MAGIPDLSIPVLPQASPGAVRVFSRGAGSEILVTAGMHALAAGDDLAHVWWVQSAEVAAEVVKEAIQLLEAAHFPIVDGWARFPVRHVPNLIRIAGDNRFAVLCSRPSAKRTQWTHRRVARFGFLVGRGWDAKRIAADPSIGSTPNNIHRQAHRFGLSLGEARDGGIGISVAIGVAYERAAAAMGMTREALMSRVLADAVDRLDALRRA